MSSAYKARAYDYPPQEISCPYCNCTIMADYFENVDGGTWEAMCPACDREVYQEAGQ